MDFTEFYLVFFQTVTEIVERSQPEFLFLTDFYRVFNVFFYTVIYLRLSNIGFECSVIYWVFTEFYLVYELVF